MCVYMCVCMCVCVCVCVYVMCVRVYVTGGADGEHEKTQLDCWVYILYIL